MTREERTVIEFPAWRRTAHGAPGVEPQDRDVPSVPGSMAGWQPRPGEDVQVHGLDEPVWHEGATRSGDVLVRMRADVLRARPPIWRRLACHGSLTLDRLHPLLAAAFGWPEEHEYVFADVVREGRSTRVGVTFGNRWTPPAARLGPEEWTVPLSAVLGRPRDRLRYRFGRAGLEVTIVAEDVMPHPPVATGDVPPARVLAGRRAAPPTSLTVTGAHAAAEQGTPGRRASSALFDLTVPEGSDPEAFDLAATDRRVRAVAEADRG